MELRGTTPSGREVRARVEGEGHPSYLATARMLGEAGMLLAEEGLTPQRGGCLTPAGRAGNLMPGAFAHARVRFSDGARPLT